MASLDAHHYAVIVSDLDETLPFYRDVLGFSVLAEFTLASDDFATAIDVPNATGSFAHLDAGGSRVELIEYEPTGGDRRGADVNDTGSTHVGFSTDDVDAFYDSLPEDVEALSPPQTTDSGARILFLRDPDGNLVEVLNP